MLARAIKSEPNLPQPRLILLNSLGQHFSTELLRDAGISAGLVKPVKQSELFNGIMEILAKEDSTGARLTGAAEPQLEPHSVTSTLGTRSLRILVAEDNLVNQKVALRQLKKLGYSPDAVANGLKIWVRS